MTIGIDASRANSQQRTGTEWYSFHVIQGLKELIPAEHKVILYTKEPLREDLADLPANWESRVLSWRPGFLWTQLRLSFEMLVRRPDLLYIPAHTIPLIHPKKVALVVHDVGFARHDELYDDEQIGYNSSIARTLINLLVRVATLGKYSAREQDYHRFSMDMALKHATSMITVSEFSKQEIHDVYGYPLEGIAPIYNGINIYPDAAQGSSAKSVSEVLQTYGLSENEPYLYFIGRLEQKKNIPRLIEAFAQLRTKHGYTGKLVLTGAPGYKYDEIQESIATHDLEDSVIETGWTPSEDVGVLLRQAQLFVFPSLYEGFGIPLLEALAVGTPVIAADIQPLREIGKGIDIAYMNPKDAASMADAMSAVLQNEPALEHMRTEGPAVARTFTWQRTAEETWDVLRTMMAD